MNKKRIVLSAFTLFTSMLLLQACGGSDDAVEEKVKPLEFAQKVIIGEVDIPYIASVTGTVKAIERVTLSSRVNGHIIKLAQREGDRVAKGDLLVEIDASTLQADIANARAALAEAKSAIHGATSTLNNASREYKRAKSLFKEKTISKSLLDQRQTEYERSLSSIEQFKAKVGQAESQIQLIEVNLNFTKIYAPFDGVIISKNIEEGELASAGTPLLTVEDTSNLEVVAEVKESDLPFINPKLNIEDGVGVQLNALELSVPGTLSHIIPSGDPFSHTFKVKVKLAENKSILSGMFARLNFQSDPRKGFLIPKNMIIERGELTGVKVLKDNTVNFRVVRTGAKYGDNIEILSGLNVGDVVVYSPFNN